MTSLNASINFLQKVNRKLRGRKGNWNKESGKDKEKEAGKEERGVEGRILW